MSNNAHADTVVKMKLLTPDMRVAVRDRCQRMLADPAYSEKVRLARFPVVDQERHLRQARDLIAAIDQLA